MGRAGHRLELSVLIASAVRKVKISTQISPPPALAWKLLQHWRNIDNSKKLQKLIKLQGGLLDCTLPGLKTPAHKSALPRKQQICPPPVKRKGGGMKRDARCAGAQKGRDIWVGTAPSFPCSPFPSIQAGIHLLCQKKVTSAWQLRWDITRIFLTQGKRAKG